MSSRSILFQLLWLAGLAAVCIFRCSFPFFCDFTCICRSDFAVGVRTPLAFLAFFLNDRAHFVCGSGLQNPKTRTRHFCVLVILVMIALAREKLAVDSTLSPPPFAWYFCVVPTGSGCFVLAMSGRSRWCAAVVPTG